MLCAEQCVVQCRIVMLLDLPGKHASSKKEKDGKNPPMSTILHITPQRSPLPEERELRNEDEVSSTPQKSPYPDSSPFAMEMDGSKSDVTQATHSRREKRGSIGNLFLRRKEDSLEPSYNMPGSDLWRKSTVLMRSSLATRLRIGKIREVGVSFAVIQIFEIDTIGQYVSISGHLTLDWIASPSDIVEFERNPRNFESEFDFEYYFPNNVDLTLTPVGHARIMRGWRKNDENMYVVKRLLVRGKFVENFEVENFPFDVQNLSVQIRSLFFDLRHLRMVPSRTEVSCLTIDEKNWIREDWNLKTHSVEFDVVDFTRTYREQCKEMPEDEYKTYSNVTFVFQVRRVSGYIVKKVLLWIFCLGLLSFSLFSIPSKDVAGRYVSLFLFLFFFMHGYI